MRRVDHEPAEGLAMRAHQAHHPQPLGGDAAGRGLALADLVAVEHEHARARCRPARAPRRARRSSRRRSGRRQSPASGVRLGPLLVRASARGRCSYPCRPSAGHRHDYRTSNRRGLGRPLARDRRPDSPQLRRHPRPLRGGRRGVREGRPHRPGRGPGRHRLQERGRHPHERALDPQVGRSARRGGAGRGGRRPRPHQGGPGRPARALQEARPLREGVAQDRGSGRVGRAGRGHGHRGRQGRADHRPRRARLPAGLAGGHPPRPEPRRVPRPPRSSAR